MSWPEESVLRAILTLSGVSGQTISDIEDYLGDPCMLQEMEVRELAAMRHRELVEEIDAKEIDPEGEAHALRRRLCAAVNAHWHQLIAAGAV